MNKAIVHHYFPKVVQAKPDEQEAVRQIKLGQRLDLSLIEWGQSFIADSSGGTRHQILSIRKVQPRST